MTLVAATTDLSRQLRTERGHFIRFAWVAGLLAVIALPVVLVLGILLQQQFSPLAVPDPTIGWKDRVWDRAGQDVARCLSREDEGGGACVITAIPPLD